MTGRRRVIEETASGVRCERGGRCHGVHVGSAILQIFGGHRRRIIGAGHDTVVLVRLEQLLIRAHHHHSFGYAHRRYCTIRSRRVVTGLFVCDARALKAVVGTVVGYRLIRRIIRIRRRLIVIIVTASCYRRRLLTRESEILFVFVGRYFRRRDISRRLVAGFVFRLQLHVRIYLRRFVIGAAAGRRFRRIHVVGRIRTLAGRTVIRVLLLLLLRHSR